LLWDGQMPTPEQLAFDGVQLGRHPLRVGDPLELEASLPRLGAYVREAEEAKPAPRGAMRKEMTEDNISSVLAGMPAPG
jgi:hypothetical protein